MHESKELEKLLEGVNRIFEGDSYKRYLDVVSSVHNYSFYNCALIFSQYPEASLVMGMRKWNQFGRKVKRGETGIRILLPLFKKKEEAVDDSEGVLKGFKVVSVFDISQTEGEPVELPCAKQLKNDVQNFEYVISVLSKISPLPIYYEQIAVNGVCRKDSIVICSGMSELQTIKTLIHEIAHALMHLKVEEYSREKKEVEAESVAYVVCKRLGLDTSDYSFGYVAAWSQGKSFQELKASIHDIESTANTIFAAFSD